jgi:hypothetical protein
VPLSALGMAKTALYDGMREQGVGRAELARRLRWHLPQVNRFSTRVMLREWNTWRRHSPRSAGASSSTWHEPHDRLYELPMNSRAAIESTDAPEKPAAHRFITAENFTASQ